MTTTRAESVRDVRPRQASIITGAVDPRGTARHSRSDVSVVEVAPDRPQYALTDGPDPATRIVIATEIDRANIPEETDRGRGHVADLVRGTNDEVAVVIAAGTDTGTGRAVGITRIGHPRTNPTLWMNMGREQGW